MGYPSETRIEPGRNDTTEKSVYYVLSRFSVPRLPITDLQKNDRSNHRDDHYHCHGQPDLPVFLLSRSLPCLRCLISRGPLCGPSCLFLLLGFLRLCHFLPFSLVGGDDLHNWGTMQTNLIWLVQVRRQDCPHTRIGKAKSTSLLCTLTMIIGLPATRLTRTLFPWLCRIDCECPPIEFALVQA